MSGELAPAERNLAGRILRKDNLPKAHDSSLRTRCWGQPIVACQDYLVDSTPLPIATSGSNHRKRQFLPQRVLSPAIHLQIINPFPRHAAPSPITPPVR